MACLGKPVRALGLMTGTIIDGFVDVAVLETDGVEVFDLGPASLVPYDARLNALLKDVLEEAVAWHFDGPEPKIFQEAERALTLAQAEAVRAFLSEAGLSRHDIDLIGFHGQTVFHRAPENGHHGQTRQLGDGQLMADELRIDVAYDFRTADMQAGGHGAPLSACYHAALMRYSDLRPNTAVLNLGGVANITWWGGEDEFVGFDSGPASGPINDWVARHGLGEMDLDGRLALEGVVDEARLSTMMEHPFFSQSFPKSLDRFDFTDSFVEGLSPEDGAATLSAFIGETIDAAFRLMPLRPDQLITCGGGRNNPALLRAIAERADVVVKTAEDVGWRGDAVEAECFGYLAVRTLNELPFSFPFTTGVEEPMTGGVIAKGALQLAEERQ
ncbi:MAG: anhydro-N-acetylmuramic acid kinase [Pseudomonadota bacterium]